VKHSLGGGATITRAFDHIGQAQKMKKHAIKILLTNCLDEWTMEEASAYIDTLKGKGFKTVS